MLKNHCFTWTGSYVILYGFAADILDTRDCCGQSVLKSQMEKKQPALHFLTDKKPIRDKLCCGKKLQCSMMNTGYTYCIYISPHVNNCITEFHYIKNCLQRSCSQRLMTCKWTGCLCEMFCWNRTGTAVWLHGAILPDMGNKDRELPQGKDTKLSLH